MKNGRIFIDSFEAMEDMTRKQQGDMAFVLRALHKADRFSCFEASANPVIAQTMTTICQAKPPLLEPDDLSYPWAKAVLTPRGRALAGLPPDGMDVPIRVSRSVGNPAPREREPHPSDVVCPSQVS